MSGREVRLQEMFGLVRAFGFEPDEVIEQSLSFNGTSVEFMTMPGQVPRAYNVKAMNKAQREALNALIRPNVIREGTVTTEPTPDLCCTHGERIDRILDLLEDRKAKSTARRKPSELETAIKRTVRTSEGDVTAIATGDKVSTANPSQSIDPLAIAEAVAEATIAELNRRGRLLP